MREPQRRSFDYAQDKAIYSEYAEGVKRDPPSHKAMAGKAIPPVAISEWVAIRMPSREDVQDGTSRDPKFESIS